MVEREFRWEMDTTRHEYVVTELSDPEEIRGLLRSRIEYTAYAMGQLEPDLFARTQWYRAVGDTGSGLVLHSRGGLGDATFLLGDPGAVGAILSIYPGRPNSYTTCQPPHLDVLKRVYRLANQQPMMRMGVRPGSFRPVSDEQTVRLTGLDIRKINSLYSTDGTSAYYVPEHIDSGVYRGLVMDGRLVAVAGTHVVSRQERVAVVGNVFTHPAYRGRGFATAATSAVTEALFEFCDNVVLTVDPTNRPAVAAYDKLGYLEVCRLVEASAVRRDPTGLGAGFRRLRARMRGRRYGGAFVRRRASQG
ncbi:MAG: GNAT family N-acetyltransferase [Dehalococcoidia bacterium]|nr:GNAT family N-acetyltransferase [Dehalococcoidia bacterium]MCA9844535.1 GNAT family N-acetyltransferase [Dehalococcoidia bacterium]MCA9855559.1 GNAT family N-acetyltransferase [Dehalococcoidia bacterium]